MSEINTLVEQLAAAYLLARGREFKHLGVVLPLDRDVLTMAIQSNVVGACLERGGGEQGLEDAMLLLRHMVTGNELTPLGRLMLDEMNSLFCAEVREMLDEGKDPLTELAREQGWRATQ